MAISARNAWPANVEALDQGPVSTEVRLRLETGEPVASTVTTASAERLGLTQGGRTQVLVKASHVLLLDGRDADLATSARNRIAGEITEVEHGAVHSIVRLRSDGGTEVTASITRSSAQRLGLASGRSATALIKASDVLLMTE